MRSRDTLKLAQLLSARPKTQAENTLTRAGWSRLSGSWSSLSARGCGWSRRGAGSGSAPGRRGTPGVRPPEPADSPSSRAYPRAAGSTPLPLRIRKSIFILRKENCTLSESRWLIDWRVLARLPYQLTLTFFFFWGGGGSRSFLKLALRSCANFSN